MLKPFIAHGEFIHSFIFRMQDATSSKDYSNLISAKGRWKEYLFIDGDTQFIFDRHDEKDFIQLLRNTGFDKKYTVEEREQELSRPSKYLIEVKKLTDPSVKPRGLKTPQFISKDIRFCDKCIAEMITQYGTGFFKGNWQVSKYCNEHQVALFQLSSSSKASVVKSIKVLLRGNVPEDAIQLAINKEEHCVMPLLPHG